ncbi:Hypothetical predicted protein [Octopus vulgaris]|uniref:Transmembrane protein n=1 Tax=Octopus vulgaris TaxID=6645 RepID=A0AA36B1I6_OCTVU|nr:Hypothetical predicted protein [Octopus vulgaris]
MVGNGVAVVVVGFSIDIIACVVAFWALVAVICGFLGTVRREALFSSSFNVGKKAPSLIFLENTFTLWPGKTPDKYIHFREIQKRSSYIFSL